MCYKLQRRAEGLPTAYRFCTNQTRPQNECEIGTHDVPFDGKIITPNEQDEEEIQMDNLQIQTIDVEH